MKPYCTCGHAVDEHLDYRDCVRCECDRFNDATTQYTEHYSNFGTVALARAELELLETGTMRPFFVLEHCNRALDLMTLPAALCDVIVDIPQSKRVFFHAMREAITKMEVRMACFVSDCWSGRRTDVGTPIDRHAFVEEIATTGLETMEKRGLLTRAQALTVSVQSPEHFLLLMQFYDRDEEARSIHWLERFQIEGGMDQFEGTTKLFGTKVTA